MYQIVYYDYEEFLVFLKGLPPKLAVKITDTLELVGDGYDVLKHPLSKHLEAGIYELRIKQASDIARVFYFYDEGRMIIITNAYLKKANKTDKRELSRARMRKKEYADFKKGGE